MHHFPTYFMKVLTAHAVLGILTFTVLFPTGVLIRILDLPNSRKIHGYVQTFAYCVLMSVVGMGIWIARTVKIPLDRYHPTIGLVLFSLVTLQYCGGFAHYLFWRRDSRHTIIGTIHENVGRVVICLGLIQAGLGLHFAHKVPKAVYIVYSLVAFLVVSAYIAVTLFRGPYSRRWRGERQTKTESRSFGLKHGFATYHVTEITEIEGPSSS